MRRERVERRLNVGGEAGRCPRRFDGLCTYIIPGTYKYPLNWLPAQGPKTTQNVKKNDTDDGWRLLQVEGVYRFYACTG